MTQTDFSWKNPIRQTKIQNFVAEFWFVSSGHGWIFSLFKGKITPPRLVRHTTFVYKVYGCGMANEHFCLSKNATAFGGGVIFPNFFVYKKYTL